MEPYRSIYFFSWPQFIAGNNLLVITNFTFFPLSSIRLNLVLALSIAHISHLFGVGPLIPFEVVNLQFGSEFELCPIKLVAQRLFVLAPF